MGTEQKEEKNKKSEESKDGLVEIGSQTVSLLSMSRGLLFPDEFREETGFDTEDGLPLQCLAASGAVSSGFDTEDDLPMQKFGAPSTRSDATADINNSGEPEYVLLTSTPKIDAAKVKRPADVSKQHM